MRMMFICCFLFLVYWMYSWLLLPFVVVFISQ